MNTTTLTLKRIDPVKLGGVLGLIYFVLGLLLAIVVLIFANAVPYGFAAINAPGISGVSGAAALLLPFVYGIGAFVLGAISALAYNLVAKWTGGIEVTLEERSQN